MSVKNSGKKILIVEDERSIRQAIVKKLNREGFQVIEEINGLEGLLLAQKNKPDLILLDIIMPEMDGVTMLKKLRQDKWGKGAEVIILTNLTEATKEVELFKQGVKDYLIKSDWKISDLVKKIKNKLNS